MALFVLVFLLGYSPSIYAQNCDALVVDEAGIFGRQVDSVIQSAKKVQNLGAEVRVRTFIRGTQLDFVQEELERSCQSWRATDGGTRNNLISMLMSVEDGQFGFYVGSQWANALNRSRQNQIETDYIFPRFRDEDFSGAFVAGLGQVARIIDAQANGSLVVPSNSASPVIVQTEPTDFTGLWWVLFSVVFVGVVVGGYLAHDRKRKENERRRATQQKAIMAKREVSATINKVSDSLPGLEARIAALSGSLSKNDLSDLNSELRRVEDASASVSESFARIGMGKTDAEQNNLTAQEYENIESEYHKLMSSAVQPMELNNKIDSLVRLAKELPTKIQEVKTLLESVNAQIVEVEKSGFKIDEVRVSYSSAVEDIINAEAVLTSKEISKSKELTESSERKANEALSSAKSLRQRRLNLVSATELLNSRIKVVDAFIDATHLVFKGISNEFAESCWESVKGNGVEAEERLTWATESVKEAVSLANMENQKWDEADQLVKEITQRLDEAESLMRSIVALGENLQVAKHDSQKEIDDAQADIQKAWDYVHEYDDDIPESYEGDLKNAESHLNTARSELEITKPDYLYVVKLAQSANSSADTILAKSRSEHETAERLRQKAASSVRDAKVACSKAKEYIEDHRGEVGSSAKSDLAQAAMHLTSLDDETDLNKKIKTANEVEHYAQNAYKTAKKNVDDAESERARRRPAVIIPSSSSYRPSSSGSSSRPSSSLGGSRSFGSSSRIGGSRSFGSSTRTGGSRSWK